MQQLGAERDPIRAHIEGLENHIQVMYEELVDEFEMKKNAGDDLAKKDIKVKELQSELNHYKQG